MDKKAKVSTTVPSPMQPQPSKQWFNLVKTFIDVPNPRIVTIFLISSLATFTSVIAFFFEWAFHGKNHTGFNWIIYYALFLFFILILVWLALGILMVVSSRQGSKQVASSVVEEEEQSVDVSAIKCGNEENKDDDDCRSLAVVVDSDTKNYSERMLFESKAAKLKRAVSYPLHSQVRSCRTR